MKVVSKLNHSFLSIHLYIVLFLEDKIFIWLTQRYEIIDKLIIKCLYTSVHVPNILSIMKTYSKTFVEIYQKIKQKP